jgi:hypothetical protein
MFFVQKIYLIIPVILFGYYEDELMLILDKDILSSLWELTFMNEIT